jgi:hypothetical protein
LDDLFWGGHFVVAVLSHSFTTLTSGAFNSFYGWSWHIGRKGNKPLEMALNDLLVAVA